MSLMGAYDDDDGGEEEGGSGNAEASAGGQGQGAAVKEGEGREEEEEEEEDSRPRKRKIRWLDETAGNIESYDVKRQKAHNAGVCVCLVGGILVCAGAGCRCADRTGRICAHACMHARLSATTHVVCLCVRARASADKIPSGIEAQTPSSSWALKLKEEQQAFAEVILCMCVFVCDRMCVRERERECVCVCVCVRHKPLTILPPSFTHPPSIPPSLLHPPPVLPWSLYPHHTQAMASMKGVDDE